MLTKSIVFLGLFISLNLNLNNNFVFNLGESKCHFNIIKKNLKSNIGLILLHENESTCVESFNSQELSSPFYLIQIKHGNGRLIKLKLHSKNYFFDPNRIFTKKGIELTLTKYNNKYPKEVYNVVKTFSDSLILKLLPKNRLDKIIALHNNTDRGYSINSYLNSINTDKLYVNKFEDPDDFYLVTSLIDYENLKKSNYNVVLQSTNAEDDGSLSVYCQQKKIQYINIEAQHGHLKNQKKMIKKVETLL